MQYMTRKYAVVMTVTPTSPDFEEYDYTEIVGTYDTAEQAKAAMAVMKGHLRTRKQKYGTVRLAVEVVFDHSDWQYMIDNATSAAGRGV